MSDAGWVEPSEHEDYTCFACGSTERRLAVQGAGRVNLKIILSLKNSQPIR